MTTAFSVLRLLHILAGLTALSVFLVPLLSKNGVRRSRHGAGGSWQHL